MSQRVKSPAEDAPAASERLRVFLRARPLTSEEVRGKDSIAVTVNPTSAGVTMASRVKDAPSKEYHFDGVFTENSDQKHVYDSVVAPAVRGALDGFNCTVFAYGQTGTGKTFTMEGGLEGGAAWSADHPESGMIPRAVRDVFSQLGSAMDSENSVRVSHMELFNEELIDLLSVADDKPLRLFDHPKEGVTVHNLESVPVTSADAIFKILRKSSIKRQEAATRLNAASSRSHCIFTITVSTKEAAGDGSELIRVGRLNLIDLAGSENVAKSGTHTGEAKREAGAINQSLLVLGRVLAAVAENRPHVPYRESKLTRIMADAVGGKHKTSMIACITQAASSYDETQSTLDYAAAARKIKNRPEANAKVTKRAVIKEYLHEIERLKLQVTAAQEKNGVYMSPEEHKQLQEELKNARAAVASLDEQLTKRSKQLDDTTALYAAASERLRETSEVLQATDAELGETKIALADTQSSLEAAQDSLEEHGAVIRHAQTTEAKLHRNASAILGALDERERDVEGLHSKVARKAAVEADNKLLSSSFRTYVAGKVDEMNGQLQRFRGTQAEQFAKVKSTVQGFMEEKTADMDKLCEKLDALQALLQDTQGRLSATVASHAQETASDLASIAAAASQGRAQVGDALAQFVATSTTAIDEWRAQLASQREAVTEWSVNTAASVQMALDANDEWSTAHSDDLKALRTALDANSAAAVAWTAAHRQSIEAAVAEHKERTARMQRDMFRAVSDLVSGYVVAQQKALAANVAELSEHTSVHARAMQAQHDVRAKAIETSVVPALDARNKKLQSEFAALEDTINAQTALTTRQVAAEEARADRLQSAAESVRDAVVDLNADAAARSQADAEAAEERAQQAAEQRAAKLDELAAQTAMWRDEATELEMVSRSSIEETQIVVEAKIRALEAHTSKYGDSLQSEIRGVQDQFLHYFDSLREDAPTGETPQKRVVPHPTTLPRAPADEEIIAEYVRAKKAGRPMAPLRGEDEFADFALADAGYVDATPTQPARASTANTGVKAAVGDSQRKVLGATPAPTSVAKPVAATAVAATVVDLADKKAAVKAQRAQQGSATAATAGKALSTANKPATATTTTSLKAGAVGGPQRAALQQLNRQNSK